MEEHIRLEAEAIKTYKELMVNLENEKEKLIINAIYTDEIRHHHLLKKIHKIIVEKETLTEEEIWQYICGKMRSLTVVLEDKKIGYLPTYFLCITIAVQNI